MEIQVVNATSPKHHEQMLKLATFCGAQKISYQDLGNGEDYILEKMIDGKNTTLVVKARGNKIDGGYLCIDDKI